MAAKASKISFDTVNFETEELQFLTGSVKTMTLKSGTSRKTYSIARISSLQREISEIILKECGSSKDEKAVRYIVAGDLTPIEGVSERVLFWQVFDCINLEAGAFTILVNYSLNNDIKQQISYKIVTCIEELFALIVGVAEMIQNGQEFQELRKIRFIELDQLDVFMGMYLLHSYKKFFPLCSLLAAKGSLTLNNILTEILSMSAIAKLPLSQFVYIQPFSLQEMQTSSKEYNISAGVEAQRKTFHVWHLVAPGVGFGVSRLL